MSLSDEKTKLERRVVAAAEAALSDQGFVSAIDVFLRLRWLAPSHLDAWRQGRIESLEHIMSIDPVKLEAVIATLERWAASRDLVPQEVEYVARTRDRRTLRFNRSGTAVLEQQYRTHWISPEMPESTRQQLVAQQSRPADLVVISPLNDWACTSCSGTGDLLILEEPGPLCLRCADLDHLVFLGAGDAALTRRAKKASRLSAVVVRFSRARRRYERQGVLVEAEALAAAEEACLADEEVRRRRRERAEVARAAEDVELQSAFAAEVSRLFPSCPPDRAAAIARHAGARNSGRVGRTAAGRALDERAVTLAVVASIRHLDTEYDRLLMAGTQREDARDRVRGDVERVLEAWRRPRSHDAWSG